MVDLVDYWVSLESSISSDPARNFAFAIRRGTWTATTFLVEAFERHGTEQSLDIDVEFDERPMDLAVDHRSPEVIYEENEEFSTVWEKVAQLSPEEYEGWFKSFIEGESVRQAAAREGVHRRCIEDRRRRGVRRLAAEVHGVAV